MESVGRILLGLGLVLLVAGGVFYLLGRLGLGSLPGDISIRRGNLRVFIPLGTSLMISVALTLLLNLFFRR